MYYPTPKQMNFENEFKCQGLASIFHSSTFFFTLPAIKYNEICKGVISAAVSLSPLHTALALFPKFLFLNFCTNNPFLYS